MQLTFNQRTGVRFPLGSKSNEMLKKGVWYKCPETDSTGLVSGTYTYFQVIEYIEYVSMKIDIYDLARDTGIEEPFLSMVYERKQIEPYAREISREEIGHSLAFIAKLLLGA